MCSQSICFTRVPVYGSFGTLSGRVDCKSPLSNTVAVYIFVSGGWWSKPTFDYPRTAIQADNTFKCNITTGGRDQLATSIAAFVIPASYAPPVLAGVGNLPQELYQRAVAHTIVDRPALYCFRYHKGGPVED